MLHLMNQFFHMVHPQHSRVSLQGVGRPQQFRKVIAIAGILFKPQQSRFQGLQMLATGQAIEFPQIPIVNDCHQPFPIRNLNHLL